MTLRKVYDNRTFNNRSRDLAFGLPLSVQKAICEAHLLPTRIRRLIIKVEFHFHAGLMREQVLLAHHRLISLTRHSGLVCVIRIVCLVIVPAWVFRVVRLLVADVHILP